MTALESGNPKVLIVDDDSFFLTVLSQQLVSKGCTVDTADSRDSMFHRLEVTVPDIILLDFHFPGEVTGLELCEEIQLRFKIPIILLTGRDDKATAVACLYAGADDYIVKPYHLSELLARMSSVLRARGWGGSATRGKPIALADSGLEFDEQSRSVSWYNRSIVLSEAEAMLMGMLLRSFPNHSDRRDCTRLIFRREWESGDRAVDVLASRLKSKLRKLGGEFALLPVRNRGYKIVFSSSAILSNSEARILNDIDLEEKA